MDWFNDDVFAQMNVLVYRQEQREKRMQSLLRILPFPMLLGAFGLADSRR